MPEAAASPPRAPRRAPRRRIRLSWSDPALRSLVWQAAALGGLGLVAWWLVGNAARNLAARHIATGFGFLGRIAGIPIGEQLIAYDPSADTYGRAMVVGILNTLKVAVVGCALTTVLGAAVGIARLSRNRLVARCASVYVETLRDLPLLLQLIFWYTLLQSLPAPRRALSVGGWAYLSNRGIKVPLLQWEPAHGWALLAFALGAAGTAVWSRRASRTQAATGARPAVWPVALGLLAVLPLLVWAALGAPFVVEAPELRGFNFAGGGTLSPEYAALTLGLTLYTAAYVAEIVRSGIQAVPRGQREAAAALGLRPRTVLRRVVLPQALRVMVPPMTSQYLNLTKNSSLAVAIGYQDVVSVATTTLSQTNQAIEAVALVMAVYLAISLSISLLMNWYNARIALVER